MHLQNQVNLLFEKIKRTPDHKIFCKNWTPETKEFKIKTYKDLHQDVANIFSFIENKKRIFLISHQGYFSAVSTLTAWFNGGYFIPCTPDTPHEKIIYLLKTLQPEVILLEKSDALFEEKLKTAKINLPVYFSEDLLKPSSQSGFTFKAPRRNLSDTAYILATSGTTGTPKIIEITDRELSAYIEEIVSLLPSEPLKHLIQTFPISFDPSIGDLVWVLQKEATLIPLKPADIRHLENLLDNIDEAWWASTPSFADWSLNFLSPHKIQKKITHSFFLGEILRKSFCLRWKNIFTNTQMYNLYGPTEATISISYYHLENEESLLPDIIPIGTIHTHQKYYIETQTKELYLSGQQVIPRYFQNKNPEAFCEFDKTLWYKTGDIVAHTQNILTVTGRKDEQIKIHGQRFNPLDMEIFLQKKDVNIILIPIQTANQEAVSHLIAFTTDKKLTLESIYQLLKDHYPLIFFPKALYHLEKFPLSASGKVDRRQLKTLKN